jgi:hypothetical protein
MIARNDNLVGTYFGYASDGNGWIQQMRNDSATAYNLVLQPVGGNVGIGTTSPSYTLQVNNSSGASATTTSSGVAEFRAQGGGYSGSYNTSLRSIAGAIGVLQLGNNNDNYILAGNTAANGYLIIRVSCSSESISSGIEAMRITSTGNVGIGTSSPSCKLDTYGTSGTTSLRVRDGNLTATAQILLECANTYSGTSQAFIKGVGTNGGNNSIDLAFGTSSGSSSAAERMRIGSDGNVVVGGTSAVGKLTVIDNSVKTTSDIPRAIGSNNPAASQMQLLFYRNINLYFNIQAIEQGTAYRSIYLNLDGGAVYAGTQRLDNNSDVRVKENIQPIGNALDTILSLKGRKFNMIDEDNVLRYGFIAQEVQPILNDFVTESSRNYKDGDNIIENLLTLETSGAAWAALLVEAIKELKAEIDTLKNK